MSTFKQYLQEVLDSKVDLIVGTQTKHAQTWMLKLSGSHTITFYIKWFGENCDFFFRDDEHGYDLSGRGEQFKIFAAAKQILTNVIKERKPNIITFEADKESSLSREKLYRRFLQRWTPEGYDLGEYGDRTSTFFQLRKKQTPIKFNFED